MFTTQILSAFPKALKNVDLVSKVSSALKKYDYGKSTLLATSLCCDELSRELENDFAGTYGYDFFSMGGLSGFPFAGQTGFGAMAGHIPDGGSCLIVYGSHVGIDDDGVIGQATRPGKAKSDACCGSANAAAATLAKIRAGEMQFSDLSFSASEHQQQYVVTTMLPHADRLAKAEDPAVELPFAIFDQQKEMMDEIVGNGASAVPGKITLLGGIQINTHSGTSDYYLPLSFEVRDNKNDLVADLLTSDLQ